MNWMLNGLLGAAGLVISVIFRVIGAFMDIIAKALFWLVAQILDKTIFAPFTFVHTVASPSLSLLGGNAPTQSLTAVGTVANDVWATMAVASAGVALVMVLMAIFSRHILTGLNGQQSWTEIGEGLAVWMAVLVGGWGLLNLLLGISNTATGALVGSINQITPLITHLNGSTTGTGLATGIAVVFTSLLWPLSAILMAVLLIWAVGVWLMRQVDLVLYAGLLPLMAAIGIGGNKTPFKWAWSEAMGAVFNQLAMAFIMWIGFLFLKQESHSTIVGQLIEVMLAVSAFTMVAKAPQILGNITGHRSAGSGHLIAGMATGYLAGKGLQTAVKATPMGQAVGKAMEGQQARSAAKVTSWAGRSSVGEKLGTTGVGQRVKNWAHTTAESVAGSSVGQAVQQKATAFAEAHPTIAGGAKGLGHVGGQIAKGATSPVRTAASMMYQPMTTLGRMASRGQADSSMQGPAGTMNTAAEATMFMAEHGVHAAAQRYFAGENGAVTQDSLAQLGQMTNAHISAPNPAQGRTEYGVEFAQGSWQGQLYQNTIKSPLQQIPTTVSKPKDQRVYG